MRNNRRLKKKDYLKDLRKTPYPLRKGMSEPDSDSHGDIVKDFQSTGRTGRRNAMADVLGPNSDLSTADLPTELEKLTTNDDPEARCSSSSSSQCSSNDLFVKNSSQHEAAPRSASATTTTSSPSSSTSS